MVEMQIRSKQPETQETNTTNIDIGEMISKVKEFVDDVRGAAGQPMDVRLDSFDFSVGKKEGEYTVSFNTKIAIKQKTD